MLLSDRDIGAELDRERIRLEPYEPAMIPSSIDVRLDRYFRLFDNYKYPFMDPAEDRPSRSFQNFHRTDVGVTEAGSAGH